MECPRDGTELAKVRVLGLELDKCHKCDGIWFDRGELERIRESARDDIEEVLEEKYGDPAYTPGRPRGYMRCPRCGARLQQQRYTYVNPVRIDRCEKCLGFWVDDTELDAIVEEREELEGDNKEVKGFLRAVFEKLTGKDDEDS